MMSEARSVLEFLSRALSSRAFREFLIVLIGSLAGAWAGGLAAFRAQARREDTKAEDERFSAGKHAQFTLIAHFNLLTNIWNQWLGPHTASPGRWAELRPAPIDRDPLSVEIKSLVSMLEGDPQFFAEISMANDAFFAVLDVTRRYSAVHVDLQKQLASLGFNRGQMEGEELIENIGRGLYMQLKNLSDELFSSVPREIERNREIAKRLGVYLRRHFPKRKYLDFEPLESAIARIGRSK